MAPGAGDSDDELALIELIAAVSAPPRAGELWTGDDAAVLSRPMAGLLVSTDAFVEHVHFERVTCTLDDIAWKAIAASLSDLAAMGAEPLGCVVALTGATAGEVRELAPALVGAGRSLGCPVVGGDLSGGGELSVVVTVLGTAEVPVTRAGAHAGDALFVTGPLGASAAGLRALQRDPSSSGALVDAHRRPQPRTAAGRAARRGGATAMIDISDGLALDLDRLARASLIGLELDEVPVAAGATLEDALGGGEDYELAFTAPDEAAIRAEFASARLSLPVCIGTAASDPARRLLGGRPLERRGFIHRLG